MDGVRSGKEIRILSWMRFEREGETKVPKYRLAEQHGIYRPMEEALRGKDGGQWFYLNTPRRTGEGLPEFYLQARSGLNLSGLFRLMAGDGTPTRTFYGYPNRKRETDGKKPIPNPFYPAHVDDAFIIQIGIDMPVLLAKGNDLVLSGLYLKQGHPHPIVYADHDSPLARTGLDDHGGLRPLELSLGDAHLVALHQTVRHRRIDRQDIRIGAGYPAKVLHRLVGQIRVMLLPARTDSRQKIVMRQALLHPINLLLGSMNEHIVEQQGTLGIHKLTVFVPDLDIRRGKIINRSFSSSLSALLFFPQFLPGPVVFAGHHQHIPADSTGILLAFPQF